MSKGMKLIGIGVLSILMLSGCVDQTQGQQKAEPVILATSLATVEICAKLDLPLSGIPKSDLGEVPSRYQGLPEIGMPMAPDMEVIASMNPDWVLSPVSLAADLQPKYQAIQTQYAFLNLSSIPGMYKSIQELGEIFGRQEQAEKLIQEFSVFYEALRSRHKDEEPLRVLILMGLPGSYVAATEASYVGSLVQMAGAANVYEGETGDFINVSTEDMLNRDPDIILRTAHAMPDEVSKMFADEFKTNDIWKHFRAVTDERVYDLSYKKFGMSAGFDYPEAIKELETLLYGGAHEEEKEGV